MKGARRLLEESRILLEDLRRLECCCSRKEGSAVLHCVASDVTALSTS